MSTPVYDAWVYYSTLVPGYVERFGIRGMRKRNRMLLEQLRQTRDEASVASLKGLLIENNLPLAMYAAHRLHPWSPSRKNDVWDNYSDACIALTEYVNGLGKDDDYPPYQFFQVRAYQRMYGVIVKPTFQESFENQMVTVPFDENDYPQEDEQPVVANRDFLLEVMEHVNPKRNVDIVRMFYFGDEYSDGRPMDLEEISDRLMLVRERVRQIKEKTIRNTRDYVYYLYENKGVNLEDFMEELPFCQEMTRPKPDTLDDPSVPLPFRGLRRPEKKTETLVGETARKNIYLKHLMRLQKQKNNNDSV